MSATALRVRGAALGILADELPERAALAFDDEAADYAALLRCYAAGRITVSREDAPLVARVLYTLADEEGEAAEYGLDELRGAHRAACAGLLTLARGVAGMDGSP